MRMRGVLAVVLVIATTVTAAAQSPDPTEIDEKSGAAAALLSVGGTVGGLAVFRVSPPIGIVGLVFGPSLGRWYNHEFGAVGMAVRFGAAALVLNALDGLDRGCDGETPAECAGVEEAQRSKEHRLYLGIALMGAATLYDLAQAGLGAERYNEARRRRLQIAPTLVGRNTVGLGVGMQW